MFESGIVVERMLLVVEGGGGVGLESGNGGELSAVLKECDMTYLERRILAPG